MLQLPSLEVRQAAARDFVSLTCHADPQVVVQAIKDYVKEYLDFNTRDQEDKTTDCNRIGTDSEVLVDSSKPGAQRVMTGTTKLYVKAMQNDLDGTQLPRWSDIQALRYSVVPAAQQSRDLVTRCRDRLPLDIFLHTERLWTIEKRRDYLSNMSLDVRSVTRCLFSVCLKYPPKIEFELEPSSVSAAADGVGFRVQVVSKEGLSYDEVLRSYVLRMLGLEWGQDCRDAVAELERVNSFLDLLGKVPYVPPWLWYVTIAIGQALTTVDADAELIRIIIQCLLPAAFRTQSEALSLSTMKIAFDSNIVKPFLEKLWSVSAGCPQVLFFNTAIKYAFLSKEFRLIEGLFHAGLRYLGNAKVVHGSTILMFQKVVTLAVVSIDALIQNVRDSPVGCDMEMLSSIMLKLWPLLHPVDALRFLPTLLIMTENGTTTQEDVLAVLIVGDGERLVVGGKHLKSCLLRLSRDRFSAPVNIEGDLTDMYEPLNSAKGRESIREMLWGPSPLRIIHVFEACFLIAEGNEPFKGSLVLGVPKRTTIVKFLDIVIKWILGLSQTLVKTIVERTGVRDGKRFRTELSAPFNDQVDECEPQILSLDGVVNRRCVAGSVVLAIVLGEIVSRGAARIPRELEGRGLCFDSLRGKGLPDILGRYCVIGIQQSQGSGTLFQKLVLDPLTQGIISPDLQKGVGLAMEKLRGKTDHRNE